MKFNTLFSYFILILFAPLIGNLVKNFFLFYKAYIEFKTPNTLTQLIYRLTPHEFKIWSSEYLSQIGFKNIELISHGNDRENDIICFKDNQKYYVECKRYCENKSVTLFQVEKLLGTMITDNVSNGIIITTGNISNDAKQFISSISQPYNISLITQKELNKLYS